MTSSPALDRLLASAGDIPVALAVVPMQAEPALARIVDAAGARVTVLQHGHAHRNRAAPTAKKAEFTAERDADDMLSEVRAGRDRLGEMFGHRFAPVFVPPWNRCPPALVARLPEAGHQLFSTYGPRPERQAAPALVQVNTHADPIDWRGTRGFVGLGRLGEMLAAHLVARRQGEVDAAEPTGLLTHHLEHGPEDMAAIGRLAEEIARHPAARWLAAADLADAA